jgi:hypothetical protein
VLALFCFSAPDLWRACFHKITYDPPEGPKLTAFILRLPSPIHRNPLAEIYNYRIKKDGFYSCATR